MQGIPYSGTQNEAQLEVSKILAADWLRNFRNFTSDRDVIQPYFEIGGIPHFAWFLVGKLSKIQQDGGSMWFYKFYQIMWIYGLLGG